LCYHFGMPKRLRKPPRDLNALAFAIVQATTGGKVAEERPKDPAAVAMGRKGGKKGGTVRASRMTAEERSEAARKAATARWNK
jgi:hypothetical protein